jgi:hypothetical protein
MMVAIQQDAEHGSHSCRIIDAFKLAGGRITRDVETESWRELLDPVVVDIDSGIIQLGPQSTPVQWEIVQRGGPDWDFVAEKREPGNTVLSTLRVRLWETNAQMVLTVNGFTLATGLCRTLDGEAIAGTQRTQAEATAT